ncbi:hypothetical protein [Crocosphaera sp. Alani8]|uniref:hypothetical protein n=1 Tax=Crocosphaera sp. Alani8 TaxID=3038952 RepID=UPI00313BD963
MGLAPLYRAGETPDLFGACNQINRDTREQAEELQEFREEEQIKDGEFPEQNFTQERISLIDCERFRASSPTFP